MCISFVYRLLPLESQQFIWCEHVKLNTWLLTHALIIVSHLNTRQSLAVFDDFRYSAYGR